MPDERQAFRTKLEIAIEEIGRIWYAGVRFGCGLARCLRWAGRFPFKQTVYTADVALVFLVAGRRRPRRWHIPDGTSIPAEAMPARASWRTLSWRRGTKGRLAARFAAVRVRVADGPPQRIRHMGAQHMPGEEVWLIGERRSNGERKYYLSNLSPQTPLRTLAATIKARWICEQAHQQLKEELGLDHFEGPIMAAASSPHSEDDDRLRRPPILWASERQRGKRAISGPPPQPTLPVRWAGHHPLSRGIYPDAMFPLLQSA